MKGRETFYRRHTVPDKPKKQKPMELIIYDYTYSHSNVIVVGVLMYNTKRLEIQYEPCHVISNDVAFWQV